MVQSAISSNKPLRLFIGRKQQVVREPWRFHLTRDVETVEVDGLPMSFICSEALELFISDKLFSTTLIQGNARYRRRSALIRKPKRGFIEIHLTKKHTRFVH